MGMPLRQRKCFTEISTTCQRFDLPACPEIRPTNSATWTPGTNRLRFIESVSVSLPLSDSVSVSLAKFMSAPPFPMQIETTAIRHANGKCLSPIGPWADYLGTGAIRRAGDGCPGAPIAAISSRSHSARTAPMLFASRTPQPGKAPDGCSTVHSGAACSTGWCRWGSSSPGLAGSPFV